MKKFWSKETGTVMGMLMAWFLAGAAAGALFANLAYPYRSGETEVLGIYVMERLKENTVSSKSYFYYLLEQRGSRYLFFALAGLTAASRPLAVCGMIGMGFLAGAVGSMAVLQYGIKGMLFFGAANFPQCICYIPSVLVLFTGIYMINGRIWGKRIGMVKNYLILTGLCLLGCLGGIVLETYGNPGFLTWLLSKS